MYYIFQDESLKYQLLLATCNRVDTLEKYLTAGTNVKLEKSEARVARWRKISNITTPVVSAFLENLRKKGVKDTDFDLIWSVISNLCKDTNEKAAHFNVDLPDAKKETILSALKIMGIRADAPVVIAYELIIEPLPSPFKEKLEEMEEAGEEIIIKP